MTKYFAFGSNCDPSVMEQKGVEFTARQRVVLRGYRLLFNKKALRENLPDSIGFANINRCEDGMVEGILYQLVLGALERLDETERYPNHYDRVRVVVEAESGTEECWAYQAQPAVTADGLVPSRNYLNHILAGREFLSQQYFEALDQSQSYSGECACCGRRSEVLFVREDNRLHTLCQSCREARIKWGDSINRLLTVAETASIMNQLVMNGSGFSSIEECLSAAKARNLI